MSQRVKIYIPQRSEKRRLKFSSFKQLQEFINHPRAIYQYLDSDHEFVHFESEQEWQEALEDLKDQQSDVLAVRVLYKRPERKQQCARRFRPHQRHYQRHPCRGFFHELFSALNEDVSKEEKKKETEEKKQQPKEEPLIVIRVRDESDKVQEEAKKIEPQSPAKEEEVVVDEHVVEQPQEDVAQEENSAEPVVEEEFKEPVVEQQDSVPEPVENEPVEDEPVEEQEQSKEPEEFKEELKVLETMGFENSGLNLHVLKHHKGNVEKTIDALLRLTTSLHQPQN